MHVGIKMKSQMWVFGLGILQLLTRSTCRLSIIVWKTLAKLIKLSTLKLKTHLNNFNMFIKNHWYCVPRSKSWSIHTLIMPTKESGSVKVGIWKLQLTLYTIHVDLCDWFVLSSHVQNRSIDLSFTGHETWKLNLSSVLKERCKTYFVTCQQGCKNAWLGTSK